MKKPPSLLRGILFSLAIALIITVLYLAGSFEPVENLVYDAARRLQGEQPRDSSLLLVTIDEASLKKVGRWPWPRSVMARILNIITEGNPAAIGVDIGFFEPGEEDPESDARLIKATKESGRVIYPVYITALPSLGEIAAFQKPFSKLAGAAAGIGHAHTEPSLDGVVRKVYLTQECGGETIPAFALTLVQQYLSRKGKVPEILLGPDGISVGEIRIPTLSHTPQRADDQPFLIGQNHLLYISFAGPTGSFLALPAWQVLEGGISASLFRNKIVMIGATAAGLGDISMTPFSTDRKPMPGVETQVNIINTILMENFITRTQTIWTIIEIFFLSLAAGWIFYSLTTRESILAFLFFLLSVAGIYLILLFQAGIWIDAWPLLAVILGNYLIVIVRKLGFLFRALDGEIK
ncbi:MAG: CHASE2 domain-containing protein, partial [Candidatus Auribacterota bacterium]|nr:CHASE2 domain-containing protein [Candidatus Auribacterota bacterium]